VRRQHGWPEKLHRGRRSSRNLGIGSPNAATIMDLLTAIHPEAVLFLGKCGGLKTSVVRMRAIGVDMETCP
jgi:hypothetical protein